MIEFQNVFFSYSDGDSSINKIDFSIKSGECVVLCGKSGSGKSTILRTVSGLAPVFYEGNLKGKVEIDKQIPAEMDSEERAKLFGVVFQDPRSQFFMNNVQDEICFAAENIGISAYEIKKKLDEIVEFVGIEHLLSKNIDELSSGQKQKVAIASSLILQPKVLILDEPTSNLDADGVKVLIKIIKKIKDRGISIIISEHRLEPFKEVVNRFFYIDKGMLRKIWTKEEFESLDNENLSKLGLRPKTINKSSKTEKSKNLILDIESLHFHYKRTNSGIDDINLKLYKGEVISLLGNNGAGKTTLCKVISGLLKENRGTIKYKGKAANRNLRNKFCYFVMQDADYQLYSDSVVGEISIGKKTTEKLKQDMVDSLNAFSLNELKDRHPASLSGGEKQRVILAAAYCSDADVYILDEPTSGMDGDGLRAIIKWVKLLSAKGKIVIIITHDLLLAKATSDKFLYLQEGEQIKEREKLLDEYN
ncbi:TPA: ABC transporter ATP-binding protein [Streptococcus pyogenes]|uniref:ABC transporter ATP-binding protein n=1 Tax=Parvimonas parva TaxID=2769485 RepID=A0ABS1C859_9FIRM|nr:MULTISPECIES: ABC transporter ATP-binding protein [Bacillota]HEN0166493.1 ABC transporter ATP-binding protein [Streptococcus agalactiae]AXI26797.1 ABC transporter [Gemella sp. ND 6198]MBK1468138.1 ABC transporter ATP-binding protein [Parvimonas parva]OAC90949.1 ABC transporter [Streptococcus pyogenes]OCX04571.1 ABC transporter [Streptococcus dysgalactiae subsp. equisimilis]